MSVKASLRDSESYITTIQPAAFEAMEVEPMGGEIVAVDSPLGEEVEYRRFIEYIEPPKGDVDITAADILVFVGRGIGDNKNMPVFEELADALGGFLA